MLKFRTFISRLTLALSVFCATADPEFPGIAAAAANDTLVFSQNPPVISWGAENKSPELVFLCIHGLGLHKGAYDDFGKLMSSKNIAVYAVDMRGFGDWHLNGKDELDLNQSLNDIKVTLEALQKKYPGVPLFLLGESMGGAIALQATALYPELVNGLVSSVPSGDRFSGLGDDLKVGFHVLSGGFSGRFNVGKHVVEHATNLNESLRKRWSDDPAARTDFSPNELIAFQSFMEKNNASAAAVKNTPVLVLQGAQDKLVRPGGSFNIWDHLACADRTFAASKSSEHLIFEYGQYSPDDINYLMDWVKKHLHPISDQALTAEPESKSRPQVPGKDELLASAPQLIKTQSGTVQNVSALSASSKNEKAGISYWLELLRDGKHYRCNNKTVFHSGDEIRIHVSSNMDGYAYILMKQGSSGAHAVLFPDPRTGRNNAMTALKDYAFPSASWLKFDNKPGKERVALIFSASPLDPDSSKYLQNSSAVLVSADRSGAKDLCPTRMQISWDDPNPLIMPSLSSSSSLASNTSMVKVSQKDSSLTLLSVDIELEHQE
ncbi:MAG: alpha/beta fold hydrolase [Candidatus Obscuribacterales bacterium]|nr:alpha/beta fold hydrolase [Candidatus Obscuribacterales bacterium]